MRRQCWPRCCPRLAVWRTPRCACLRAMRELATAPCSAQQAATTALLAATAAARLGRRVLGHRSRWILQRRSRWRRCAANYAAQAGEGSSSVLGSLAQLVRPTQPQAEEGAGRVMAGEAGVATSEQPPGAAQEASGTDTGSPAAAGVPETRPTAERAPEAAAAAAGSASASASSRGDECKALVEAIRQEEFGFGESGWAGSVRCEARGGSSM